MITLIIPTLNRSDFIIRYLFYLKNTNFKGCVCIGDSSQSLHLEKTKSFITKNKFDFQVIHQEHPGLNLTESIRKMLPVIHTPYAMYICDDDLLVPQALYECIHFLDKHPDYSAATGIMACCYLNPKAFGEKIVSVGEGRLNVIENDTASERLASLLGDYTVVGYSVSRTSQFKERWPLNKEFSDVPFSAELLPSCMLVAQGKLKKLDRLFVLRQIHQQHYVINKDTFDWITRPDWPASYLIFRDCLVKELVKQDGISIKDAQEVVKYAFWKRLNRMTLSKFQQRYPARSAGFDRQQLKTLIKNIPVLGICSKNAFCLLKNLSQGFSHKKISLPALLKSSSPYNRDFLAVYKAITSTDNNDL